MVQASLLPIPLLILFPIPVDSPIWLLALGAISAFVLSYLLTFVVGAFCRKVGWLDRPAARRVHLKAVPRLGGVAIFAAFLIASLLFYTPGTGPHAKESEVIAYWLLIAASVLIVLVHAYDDVKGLKPLPKLLAQTVAVIIILGPGRTVFHGILLYTFNNPFGSDVVARHLPWYEQSVIHILIERPEMSLLAIPAVIFTWFWIVGMMNTVNLIDGLDGLAAGVVGIAAVFVAIIGWQQQQYSIAGLAAIFAGSIFGFLPHNWNPAKIFMGDSGAMFLGLALAVLSIMGGAKLALVIMVLGVPILDLAVVAINRIRRGQSPLHYDKTHLHYRLMAIGLSARQICYLFYGLTCVFGLMALQMQRIYKLVGISLVAVVIVGLIVWVDYRQRQRGVSILSTPTPGTFDDVEVDHLANKNGQEPLIEANALPPILPNTPSTPERSSR